MSSVERMSAAEVLRDLLERSTHADEHLRIMAGSDGVADERRRHLISKAEGVRLVRSYLREALRQAVADAVELPEQAPQVSRPLCGVEYLGHKCGLLAGHGGYHRDYVYCWADEEPFACKVVPTEADGECGRHLAGVVLSAGRPARCCRPADHRGAHMVAEPVR